MRRISESRTGKKDQSPNINTQFQYPFYKWKRVFFITGELLLIFGILYFTYLGIRDNCLWAVFLLLPNNFFILMLIGLGQLHKQMLDKKAIWDKAFAKMTPEIRDYYIQEFGFDPLIVKEGKYEESFPLGDRDLLDERIQIIARVQLNWSGWKNEIVFNKDGREGIITCTHTITQATVQDALKFVGHATPQILPPWEHFAALKSYVGSLAENGILNLIIESFFGDSLKNPFGLNAAMQKQIMIAITSVVSESSANAIVARIFSEIVYNDDLHEWCGKVFMILDEIYNFRMRARKDPNLRAIYADMRNAKIIKSKDKYLEKLLIAQ